MSDTSRRPCRLRKRGCVLLLPTQALALRLFLRYTQSLQNGTTLRALCEQRQSEASRGQSLKRRKGSHRRLITIH